MNEHCLWTSKEKKKYSYSWKCVKLGIIFQQMFDETNEQIILNILHGRTSRLRFCLYNVRTKKKLQCVLQKNTKKNLLSEAISTAERRMKENKNISKKHTKIRFIFFSFNDYCNFSLVVVVCYCWCCCCSYCT